MVSKAVVENFLKCSSLAVVGISRKGRGFGTNAYRELKSKGYRMFPVHPVAEELDGDRCYRSVRELEGLADGLLISVPPEETEKVVREAAEAGIRTIWIQQGAESEEAIRFCQEREIEVVHGECILMFASPSKFPHNLHRWIWGAIGKLPE